jgi:hypothetical protein
MDHSGTMTGELLLEAAQALKGVFDRVNPFLEDDLLRGMIELLPGEPAPMRQRPMAASAVNPTVPQQKGKQLLAFAAKVVRRRLAGSNKVAHRLMRRVWRPHSRQFACPVQSRQCDRLAPVRLDALARPFRNQGRRDHHAVVAERLDLAIKPVSRRPGFKTDVQPAVSVRQSLDRPLDRQRIVLDIAEKPDFAAPAAFPNRHRVLLLGDIKSHKDFAMLSQGPPSVHEAPLGSPEQPSSYCTKGRTTGSAREHDV